MSVSETTPSSALPRLLSADQAGEILGVVGATVRLLTRLDPNDPAYLRAVRIGTGRSKPRVLVHPDDLEAYINVRRGKAAS